jgi:hypothetical protein
MQTNLSQIVVQPVRPVQPAPRPRLSVLPLKEGAGAHLGPPRCLLNGKPTRVDPSVDEKPAPLRSRFPCTKQGARLDPLDAAATAGPPTTAA